MLLWFARGHHEAGNRAGAKRLPLPIICSIIGAGSAHASQAAVPTIRPIPAVMAIASAPQNMTRATGRAGAAPPANAPSHPSAARNRSDPRASSATIRVVGAMAATRSGSETPAVKVAPDAATPIMRLAVETIPSFAPSTATRATPSAIRDGLRGDRRARTAGDRA